MEEVTTSCAPEQILVSMGSLQLLLFVIFHQSGKAGTMSLLPDKMVQISKSSWSALARAKNASPDAAAQPEEVGFLLDDVSVESEGRDSSD